MKSLIDQGRSLIGIGIVTAGLVVSGVAIAHIKNEASQFPDIEYSEARFDIVVLVGAGVIPETPVFEPDKTLSTKELATWAALGKGLRPGGETPDTDELADAALDAGLVDSLDGNATMAEVNRLFFDGTVTVANPDENPTKAAAASFIAAHLDSDAGRAMLQTRHLFSGAVGKVESVEAPGDHEAHDEADEGHEGDHDAHEEADEGHEADHDAHEEAHEGHEGDHEAHEHGHEGHEEGHGSYVITVGGERLPMDEHGRVANGPTDLLQWEGKTVRRSFIRRDGISARWIYLEAEPPGPEAAAPVSQDATAPGDAGEAPPPAGRNLLYWLIAAVVILGVILFFRRRKSD